MEKSYEEIDPKIKKEINQEGFDDSAAILIGKKESMPELLKKLEEEGRAADLGTYLKMHKAIDLPKEEVSKDLKLRMTPGEALHLYSGEYANSSELLYMDIDGNIASITIHPDKIATFEKIKGILPEEIVVKVEEELKQLGFNLCDKNKQEPFVQIYKDRGIWRRKLEAQAKLKREGFDF